MADPECSEVCCAAAPGSLPRAVEATDEHIMQNQGCGEIMGNI